MSKESNRDWERPWTTEEIVGHADNWSLACDSALLNTLTAFGDRILKKAEDVNNKIENLNENLEKVHLKVDLVRNEFSSLRNTQFVECRVYDDDEAILSEKPKQEETNVPEEETIEDFKQAVSLGLNILDEYYDRVNVTVSDSEDEDEVESSYVYRRKDPYINRRLPLVIGSEEWHKKWHVGLIDTDSENENSEKFSDSESEDNFSQNNDCSDVTSELSDFSGLKRSTVLPVQTTNAGTTNYDVSATKITTDASSDDVSSPNIKMMDFLEEYPSSFHTYRIRKVSFAEQLAAKLGNVIRDKENDLKESEVNKRPIQKKPSDYGALFSDEPPPLDNTNIQETKGSYAENKGLFDEDDDENDFWSTSNTATKTTKEYSLNKPNQVLDNPENVNVSKGLFDDDSDDDIFSSTKTQQIKQPYLPSKKPIVPVFDEEPPVIKEETDVKEKKKPLGGVSLFGSTDILKDKAIGKILKQRKVSSSSDEDKADSTVEKNVKTPENSVISTLKNSVQTVSVPETVQPEIKKSLFDDDIFGDDLFSSLDTRKVASSTFEKSSLFSDEETPDIFSSDVSEKTPKVSDISDTEYSFRKSSKSNIKSLFDDTIDSDIFTDVKNDTKKESNSEKSIGETRKKQSVSLFDDLDDSDDLFWGVPKKTIDKKTESLLFEDDDDFSIFKPKNVNKNLDSAKRTNENKKDEVIEKSNKQVKNTKNAKISLFDDDLAEVDDIFSKGFEEKNTIFEEPKKTSSKQSATNMKENTKTLREESKEDKAQAVDVIKTTNKKEPLADNKTIESKEKEAIINKKISIFDDLGDVDNLFFETSKKKDTTTEKQDSIGNKNVKDNNTKNEQENPEILDFESKSKPDKLEKRINSDEEAESVDVIRTNNKGEQNKAVETLRNKKISLFDDLGDIDDLFSETLKKKDTTTEKKDTMGAEQTLEIERKTDNSNAENCGTDKKLEKQTNKTDILDEIIKEESIAENVREDSSRAEDCSVSERNSLPNEESQLNEIFNEPKTPVIKIEESTDKREEKPEKEIKILDIHSRTEHSIIPQTDVEKTGEPPTPGANFKEDKYKSSPNVINVNFMDTIPPPDDDWDTYSDNIFDDMDHVNDGFQSQPSSLFDNEPPSLFFSVETERSSNNFDDGSFTNYSERDNSRIEVTEETLEESPVPTSISKNKLEKIEKEATYKPIISKKKPTPNRDDQKTLSFNSLASDLFESNPDQDQTDFLHGNDKRKISENDKIRESPDKPNQDQIETDEPVVEACSEDDMQNNISRIAERLQQISSKNEERTKPLVVPGKLSHNLNINVGALLPGSSLRKEKSQISEENESLSKSLPASRFITNEKPNIRTKPINIVKVPSEDLPATKQYHSLEKSVSFDGGTDIEILRSVTKDRAKIPVKRKPSTRRARQKSLRDSMTEFRLDDPLPDESDKEIDKKPLEKEITEVNPSRTEDDSKELFKSIEKKTEIVNEANIIKTKKQVETEEISKKESNKTNEIDSLFDEDLLGNFKSKNKEIKEKIFEKTEPKNNKKDEKKTKIDDLFDSSDDDDIFKTVKLGTSKDVAKKVASISVIGKIADTSSKKDVKIKTGGLFDFSDEDEDFLGNFSSRKTVNKKDTVKNTGTLFDEGDDDDLFGASSTVGKKNKQDVKPSVMNKKPPKPSGLRKMENVEGEEDPLSALLK